jgi:hypothetical protein
MRELLTNQAVFISDDTLSKNALIMTKTANFVTNTHMCGISTVSIGVYLGTKKVLILFLTFY